MSSFAQYRNSYAQSEDGTKFKDESEAKQIPNLDTSQFWQPQTQASTTVNGEKA